MSWLFWSLSAAAIWGVIHIIDKIVVERYIVRPEVYVLFGGLASIVPAAFVFLALDITPASMPVIGLCILTGILLISYTYFYFVSLQKADAPTIVALFQLVPMFSTIWDYIFFGKIYSITTYIGIFFVIGGAIGVSIEKVGTGKSVFAGIRISTALVLMVVSTFLASIGHAVQDYVLTITDVKTLFFWGRIGDITTTGILLSIKSLRTAFVDTVRSMFGFVVTVNLSNEIVNSIAILFLMLAYEVGPLALVSTASAIQPLFVLIFIRTINSVKHQMVPDTGSGTLDCMRVAAMIVTVVGVYLIS